MNTTEEKERKSTQAQINASVNYNKRQDNIMIRPSKEEGQVIRDAAKQSGQSVQAYILQAVRERMQRESGGNAGQGDAGET